MHYVLSDIHGDRDAYVQWAWCSPPESLNLPKPRDWDESVESLEQQGQRWQADQEREMQEIMKDLKTLERVLGSLPEDREK